MPRINRSGAATRAKIMDAAADVLVEHGFAGFTLQAVASRAGIRYGNLTHHYPTRDFLVDAMFVHLADRYRLRFCEMAAEMRNGGRSIRDTVTWLLDDSVSDGTAPVFLQLWAMASHLPAVAAGMERLYDQAVDAFMEAHGVDPRAETARDLRSALYLLGTVIEGSSAIFWTRDRSGAAFRATVRKLAIDRLAALIEERLPAARATAPSS